MNEQSFTYNGVTVQYSEQQKAIILDDQNLIAQLQQQKRALQDEYNSLESRVNEAKDKLDNYCNTLKDWEGIPPRQTNARTNCHNYWNDIWNSARARQTSIGGELTTKDSQIANATKKLNDDILTIQNDIKLQIQAQQANTAAGTAQATNQANVATAPAIAQGNIELALQEQRLRQEQNIKIAFGVFVVIIILGVAFLIRRVGA